MIDYKLAVGTANNNQLRFVLLCTYSKVHYRKHSRHSKSIASKQVSYKNSVFFFNYKLKNLIRQLLFYTDTSSTQDIAINNVMFIIPTGA